MRLVPLLAALPLALPTALAPLAAPVQGEKAAKEKDSGEKKVERVVLERGQKRTPLFMEWTVAADPAAPALLLLHAARSSKGEYRPMVPRFQALGYHCLAIDLICGGESRGVRNNTAKNARDGGRQANYLDAVPDILDALDWLEERVEGKVVLVGSSFSASLALQLAGEHDERIDGVIAFSPGEYFASVGKGTTWIQESAKAVSCPVLILSAKNEEAEWRAIFEALGSQDKTGFLPQGPGEHGAKALWEESAGNAEYWTAVEAFLKRAFPAPAPK